MVLISNALSARPSVVQVATIPGDADAGAVVDELNGASWESRQVDPDVLAGIPDAAQQSLLKAVEAQRNAAPVALGWDNTPLVANVTIEDQAESTEELTARVSDLLSASVSLGVTLLLVPGKEPYEFTYEILPDWVEETLTLTESWWTLPSDTVLIQRTFGAAEEVAKFVAEESWQRGQARIYTGFVEEKFDEGEPVLSWTCVVDMWVPDFARFLDSPATAMPEGSVLTVRNRYELWAALGAMSTSLDMGTVGELDPELSLVMEDMPAITRGQTQEWWRQMFESVVELTEAARVGNFERLAPRTPAEEALLALATSHEYLDWARDEISMLGYYPSFEDLPIHERDGELEELLPELVGDTGIKMLWAPHIDGLERDNVLQRSLGFRDYRIENWHTPYRG